MIIPYNYLNTKQVFSLYLGYLELLLKSSIHELNLNAKVTGQCFLFWQGIFDSNIKNIPHNIKATFESESNIINTPSVDCNETSYVVSVLVMFGNALQDVYLPDVNSIYSVLQQLFFKEAIQWQQVPLIIKHNNIQILFQSK